MSRKSFACSLFAALVAMLFASSAFASVEVPDPDPAWSSLIDSSPLTSQSIVALADTADAALATSSDALSVFVMYRAADPVALVDVYLSEAEYTSIGVAPVAGVAAVLRHQLDQRLWQYNSFTDV